MNFSIDERKEESGRDEDLSKRDCWIDARSLSSKSEGVSRNGARSTKILQARNYF